MDTIGKRIRLARELRGINQRELSNRLDIQQPTVSHWEADHSDMRISSVVKIAEVLAVPPGWLAFGGPLPKRMPPSRESTPRGIRE